MQKIRTIDTLTIESSLLCHNFINTVYAWRGENLNEYLKDYNNVIQWCKKLKVFSEPQLAALEKRSAAHPALAHKALVKMKEVRLSLYELVSAIAAGSTAEMANMLNSLNPLITKSLSKFELVYRSGNIELAYVHDPKDLEAPLWPVLYSLRQMLLEVDLTRVKECPTCGWVFLDQTRNGGRKWCSATECGTKDKMLRYITKLKSK